MGILGQKGVFYIPGDDGAPDPSIGFEECLIVKILPAFYTVEDGFYPSHICNRFRLYIFAEHFLPFPNCNVIVVGNQFPCCPQGLVWCNKVELQTGRLLLPKQPQSVF